LFRNLSNPTFSVTIKIYPFFIDYDHQTTFINKSYIYLPISFDLVSSCFPSFISVRLTVLLFVGPLIGCGVSNVSGLASVDKI